MNEDIFEFYSVLWKNCIFAVVFRKPPGNPLILVGWSFGFIALLHNWSGVFEPLLWTCIHIDTSVNVIADIFIDVFSIFTFKYFFNFEFAFDSSGNSPINIGLSEWNEDITGFAMTELEVEGSAEIAYLLRFIAKWRMNLPSSRSMPSVKNVPYIV